MQTNEVNGWLLFSSALTSPIVLLLAYTVQDCSCKLALNIRIKFLTPQNDQFVLQYTHLNPVCANTHTHTF